MADTSLARTPRAGMMGSGSFDSGSQTARSCAQDDTSGCRCIAKLEIFSGEGFVPSLTGLGLIFERTPP